MRQEWVCKQGGDSCWSKHGEGRPPACLPDNTEAQCRIDCRTKGTLFWRRKKSTFAVVYRNRYGFSPLGTPVLKCGSKLASVAKVTVFKSKAKFIREAILLLRKTRKAYDIKMETQKLGKSFSIKREREQIIKYSNPDIHEEICAKTFINPKFVVSL